MGFGGVNIFGARKQKKPKDKTVQGLFLFICFCFVLLAFVQRACLCDWRTLVVQAVSRKA